MKKKILVPILVIFLMFVINILPVHAVRLESIKILEYGIYIAKTIDKTQHGLSNIISLPTCIKKTTYIPAILGNRFGIRYKVVGFPERDTAIIKFKITYPGLFNPKMGRKIYSDEIDRKVEIGQESYVGYTFDSKWSLVPGKWTLQLFYNERLMAERSFSVQIPEDSVKDTE